MKNFLIISLALLIFLLTTGVASAWHKHPSHHYHYHFGIFLDPPVVRIGPPVYHREYYPPYIYYPPHYYGYRVWVPGHWEERWTSHGWETVWIQGNWEYYR
jgi:hypothetical protein